VAQFLTDRDIYLFNEGTHLRVYDHLGAHLVDEGAHFAVWAPDAANVSVVGDFNGWQAGVDTLLPSDSGIWRAVVAAAHPGNTYKYAVETRTGLVLEKSDPVGFLNEVPPKTASVVWDLGYEWGDTEWLEQRATGRPHREPMSVYEMHLGSWRKGPDGDSYSYRELAPILTEYLVDMVYTHVEFMPLTEHPFYPSWGYQVTGYFAPTSRYGTPQDLMFLIDTLHQAGIGVILDWVPSHFATDDSGLIRFDGTALYEHEDPRLGWHPDWDSAIFNYGRNEVRSFLNSSAMFWLDRYHVDALRVDAVASMLYRDYSRDEGEWIPNEFGGNENLEAMGFLQGLNTLIYGTDPGVSTIAEESTAWPGVSKPVDAGGLGFGFKWDMGWMHDTLSYFANDPVHRSYHHNQLTFRGLYQYDENFVLALSHDEVVHGKGSLVNKMPGDEWQQFANVRALLGYMYGLPGKKLMFMGGEFGQRSEWVVYTGLDWWVTEYPNHEGLQAWVRALNTLYGETPALYEDDYEPEGFEWVDASDAAASVLSFVRRTGGQSVLVALNLTPIGRPDYRLGVDAGGSWQVALNSDDERFWGRGAGSAGSVASDEIPSHGRAQSLLLDLPPLGVIYLVHED
jgi:1,4-alpha-glucan branching enzyme